LNDLVYSSSVRHKFRLPSGCKPRLV
jgi:hypothetical protein